MSLTSDITSFLNGSSNFLNQVSTDVALVTPQTVVGYQPQADPGQPGQPAFLFHFEGENILELLSDITDHFVEDNTSIEDHIGLKPEKVTVRGFIGELNDINPALGNISIPQAGQVAAALSPIDDFIPGFSASAQNVINGVTQTVMAVNSVVNSITSVINTLAGGGNQTKQAQMLTQIYGYWKTRTLFTVQTPWIILKNMAIENVRAEQDETTRMVSDYFITFKHIQKASTATQTVATPTLLGRASNQAEDLVNLGTNTPTPDISLGTAITQGGF